jgi:hypothetical protein
VPASAADATPTFAKDVAPIFYKSCIECHRATMFAPMSLTTYDDARPWVRSIRRRVIFRNDPRLTDQEIQTIVWWIDGGAPKGNPTEMPKMPALAEGWTIGKPDAIYSMTEDYKSPASGTIEYQYIRIPVNLPEDRWYTAVEIKPSARAHVHHVIAYTEPHSDKPTRPGNGDPNAEVKGVANIMQDTVITSLTPHMHVRGKDMTCTAVYPDDPTKDVKWGDQTWEEMMIGFWGSVVAAPAASQQVTVRLKPDPTCLAEVGRPIR